MDRIWGVMADFLRALNYSSDGGVIRVLVRIPVMKLVSLSKTLHYNWFSPPNGKWVPVRAEIVIVIDLA